MPLVDPQFGAYIFSTDSIVCEHWEVSQARDVDMAAASQADSGASSPGKLSGRHVRMNLYIKGASQSDLQDKLSNLHAATTSEIPLDLHLEPQYPGRYLMAKRVGDLTVVDVEGSGSLARATIEFAADEPYWIVDQATVQRVTLSSTTSTITIDLSAAGSANARWIPLLLVLQVGATTFASGKTIKVTNTSTAPNELWRYKANSDLTGGSGATGFIDGESCEVIWNGVLDNRNSTAIFPRVRGGIANILQIDLDTTGSNGINSTLDFIFAPRFG